jgi:nucleotide-binding universal stress UspA family protein
MINIRTILAPTDLSHHCHGALAHAVLLAEKLQATLHLLHVLPEFVAPVGPEPMLVPTLPEEFYAEAEKQAIESLESCLLPEWGRPPKLAYAARWGDVTMAIVDHAREVHADLLVLSTHGRAGLSHLLMGSVAERILRDAPCPVLTVRDSHAG